MHVKIISGAVASGIVLCAGHYGDALTITHAGSVYPSAYGVTAFTAASSLSHARVVNQGQITGGQGQAGYTNGQNAGAGIMIASPGEVSNSGVIAGGRGGYSTYLGSGGRGGDAIDITQTGVVHNSGTIDGGRGGMNYEYGGGGTGVNLFGGTLTNQGTISGGQGGHNSYYGTGGGAYLGAGALMN
jgi:hypothetical protein